MRVSKDRSAWADKAVVKRAMALNQKKKNHVTMDAGKSPEIVMEDWVDPSTNQKIKKVITKIPVVCTCGAKDVLELVTHEYVPEPEVVVPEVEPPKGKGKVRTMTDADIEKLTDRVVQKFIDRA